MKITVLLDWTLSMLVYCYQRFGGTICFHLEDKTILHEPIFNIELFQHETEAEEIFETLTSGYVTSYMRR
jgi:hypothetical protein